MKKVLDKNGIELDNLRKIEKSIPVILVDPKSSKNEYDKYIRERNSIIEAKQKSSQLESRIESLESKLDKIISFLDTSSKNEII